MIRTQSKKQTPEVQAKATQRLMAGLLARVFECSLGRIANQTTHSLGCQALLFDYSGSVETCGEHRLPRQCEGLALLEVIRLGCCR